ncbi:Cohesin subunit SA-2, partial [Bulinus truncatus]
MSRQQTKGSAKRRLQSKLDELVEDVKTLKTRNALDIEDPISHKNNSKTSEEISMTLVLDDDEDDSEGSLFEIIKAGKASLQAVADDWIESYKQDKNVAILELSQFFIHCSGCKGRITENMLDRMESSEIVSKLTAEFVKQESSMYPLIQSGAQWKKFKASFCEFIQVLVRHCQHSIICDQHMMDKIISLLICLADSPVRALRHTSTLTAMKLVTALVDVLCRINVKWTNLKRQYTSESAKDQMNYSEDRMENLTRSLQEDRIIEMTQDKETHVAVEAVHILTCIFRFSCSSNSGESVLSDKDCEQVYHLVYSPRRPVAVAAGHFLNHKLFQWDEEAMSTKAHSGNQRRPNSTFIRDLVQFYIESQLSDQVQYLVDSMWSINKMLKDWECMTDLLLEEPEIQEDGLDDIQESVLVEIMLHSVKQAVTGQSPDGRGPPKKFGMDPEKVINLLQISLCFNLDLYIRARQKKCLEQLLDEMRAIVKKHSSDKVLEICSKCFQYLCNEDFALASMCQIVVNSQIGRFVHKFTQAVDKVFRQQEYSPSEEDTFLLLSALRKVHAFYLHHDLSGWEIWDDLFLIFRSASEREDIPEEIIVKVLQTSSMAILFYYKRLDDKNPDSEDMKRLSLKLGFLMQSFQEYLFHEADKVKEEAFSIICDLAVMFSPNVAEDNPLLKPVVFNVDAKLTSYLTEFLLMKVFVEDNEDHIEENIRHKELLKRRNFLSSFVKLIVFKVIHIKAAAIVFRHYIKFSKDYGDIIKYTLSKSRESNRVASAKTLAISLQQMFHELQAEHGDIQTSSPSFHSIKELAKKFALSFGPDSIKNRHAIAAIHIEGIQFSLTPTIENTVKSQNAAPSNIKFFEILCEFTCKLIKQDRKTILDYLDKEVSKIKSKMKSADWQPFYVYRDGLRQRALETSSGQQKQRKERKSSESSSERSFDLRTPSPKMVLPLTSTVIRHAHVGVNELSPSSI